MFSHIVVFWTDPTKPASADQLLGAAQRLLAPIPGLIQFHVGKVVPSPRPVVDSSFQIALNLVFPDKAAHDAYQVHPLHVEFVEQHVKPLVKKITIYDFA